MDNDNYNDNYYEEFVPKQRGKVYKTFRAIALVLVALFAVFLVARMHINNTVPAGARPLLWNSVSLDALESDPQNFAIYKHELGSYVDVDTGKDVIRNKMTADAYFSFSDGCYTPAAKQFQLTVRYNVSTVDFVSHRLGAFDASRDEPFLFALVDDAGNRFCDYSYTTYAKSFLGKERYQYRRLLFEGIDVSTTQTLTLEVYPHGSEQEYYAGDKEARIDEIVVYDAGFERVTGRQELSFDTPQGVSEGLTMMVE